MKDLTQCRAEINAMDSEIVRLFEARMQVSRDVVRYKHAHHMNILDASREEAVLSSRAAMAKEDALRGPVMALYRELMRLSREEQQRWLQTICQAEE
jgi:monofunctional chorismate mutase